MTPRKAGRRPASSSTPGRQEIWTAIRAMPDLFTVTDLIDRSRANRKTIQDYLRCLLAGGVIQPEGDSGYSLIDDRGYHAPRLNRAGQPVTQGTGVENMWRSMRGLVEFSPRDIAAHSTTPDALVSEPTAKSYCSMLLRCGYLRVLKKAEPIAGRQAIYRLIRNTGPRPPQVQRIKRIFDPNTGAVHTPGDAP
ncbi:hypothetical protein F8A10_12035 [Paracoccus kondratievae]|uniref:hypothetical protein n=1 Tax=Paracoccus kondratievae TaxID=135740 RepID=UPI0012665EF0|nr:hypothetical protein [Paracoccus kondratievae]QFQ88240.1 hypothetical protein F8A10_12035 [Paracoccus kondratievae]